MIFLDSTSQNPRLFVQAPPAPDDLGDAGLLMRKDALQLHELSKAYRKKAIRRTEQQVSLGIGLMFVLSFLTQVKGQEGLEFLDVFSVEQRLYAFSLLSMAISLICYSAPIGRLWVLIQKPGWLLGLCSVRPGAVRAQLGVVDLWHDPGERSCDGTEHSWSFLHGRANPHQAEASPRVPFLHPHVSLTPAQTGLRAPKPETLSPKALRNLLGTSTSKGLAGASKETKGPGSQQREVGFFFGVRGSRA